MAFVAGRDNFLGPLRRALISTALVTALDPEQGGTRNPSLVSSVKGKDGQWREVM